MYFTRYHSEKALCELYLQALPKNVLKFHALLDEARLNVAPGEVVIV